MILQQPAPDGPRDGDGVEDVAVFQPPQHAPQQGEDVGDFAVVVCVGRVVAEGGEVAEVVPEGLAVLGRFVAAVVGGWGGAGWGEELAG